MRSVFLIISIIVLILLPVASPAAEGYEASDINDFSVKVSKDIIGYLKQANATEVAVVPFKNTDDNESYAFSDVLTGQLLQELRYNSDLKILTPTDEAALFRVSGLWTIAGEEVKVTVRITKMPSGTVEINYTALIPLKRVPKVYLAKGPVELSKPDKGVRIAIMDFDGYENFPQLKQLTRGIPEAVTTVFARNSDLVLIERMQLDKIKSELNLAESRFTDPDSALKIGKLINANYMIIGSYQQHRRNLRLMARRVKVETGEIFEAADVIGVEDDLFQLEDDLAKKLLEDIMRFR